MPERVLLQLYDLSKPFSSSPSLSSTCLFVALRFFFLCVVRNVALRDGHYWVLRSMRKFSRVGGLGFYLKGFFSARCRKLSNCTVEIKEMEFERFVLCFSNSQCQSQPRGMDCRCLFPQGTSAKSATFALP
jgi:hypothetical protein